MTLAEMRSEIQDRGYKFVNEARLTGFLQRAYQQLCARQQWPFLEVTSEGSSPLAVTDVRKILSVRDKTKKRLLRGVTREYLTHYYPRMDDTGDAEYWYLDGNTVRLYPVATTTLEVRYVKAPTELADGEEPLVPKRWQYLIIDRAIVDCLRNGNEYDAARSLMTDIREGQALMISDLLHRNLQDPRTILRTGSVDDYL